MSRIERVGDKITIQDAQAFIHDAQSSRSNWLSMAEQSWSEIKKRQKNNRLWAVTPNSVRRRNRYPVWYSIFKIRQPLLLARIGIPIGKDTTQDGNDNVGATAAICLERLAVNLAKSFDFFDVMCASRDDFLATCFGLCRAYYSREELKEQVKEYIAPQKDEATGDFVFVREDGSIVESDDIMQDDEGFYLEHDEVVDVENEKVCLEPVLYRHVYIDPDATRINQVRRVAFENMYCKEEFISIFGEAQYNQLPAEVRPDYQVQNGAIDQSDAERKKRLITVYELWSFWSNEVKWFVEGGTEFLTPEKYQLPDEEEGHSEEETANGIYDLEGFFPMPKPLLTNAPTDEFWPVPEYYQMREIIEDIHTLFSRMATLARAIRSRLLFDNSVTELQVLVNEAGEADAIGVTNLAQSLNGGDLSKYVAYIPVEKMVEALQNVYVAFTQRLETIYKLTGTSDLLQGMSSQNTDKTLGERQMEEKYAINQIAEPQRKMQEFVRDCYQLISEVALKNFKDASLDKYIMPETLQPEDRQRYKAAIGLLRQNAKRFRIELETDSTIAINEAYDKQVRVELVNALTTALEKTANIAQTSPALVAVELHALKFLIQGFRQGKMFQSEVTAAIDNVIKQAESAPAPFNAEQKRFELEMAKLQQKAMTDNQQTQMEMQKLQIEGFAAGQKSAYEQKRLMLEQQRQALDQQIAMLNYMLDRGVAEVEIQNKLADNRRLEAEAATDMQRVAVEARAQQPNIVVVPQAQPVVIPQAPQAAPTIINAPNPAPQTQVVQPVQEVPVPVPVPGVPF